MSDERHHVLRQDEIEGSDSESVRAQASGRLRRWQSCSSLSPGFTTQHDAGEAQLVKEHSIFTFGRSLRLQAQKRLSSWQKPIVPPQGHEALAEADRQVRRQYDHLGHDTSINELALEETPARSHIQPSSGIRFLPAYAFTDSSTYFSWTKLTASDIHLRLRKIGGYQHSWVTESNYVPPLPQLLFFQNHPIQFVEVVGVVIAFDEYLEKRWLFTIDDGSGMTIDVLCLKPSATESSSMFTPRHNGMQKEDAEALQLSDLVKNLVDVGAVLRIRGTVTLFRRQRLITPFATEGRAQIGHRPNTNSTQRDEVVRQIHLQSLKKITTTQEEIELIVTREEYRSAVLEKPWHLDDIRLEELQQETRQRVAAKRKKDQHHGERERKKRQREQRHAALILEHYVADEKLRELAAEEAQQQAIAFQHDNGTSERESARSPVNPISIVSEVASQQQCHELPNATSFTSANDSFGATVSEKSALLHAAFGHLAQITR